MVKARADAVGALIASRGQLIAPVAVVAVYVGAASFRGTAVGAIAVLAVLAVAYCRTGRAEYGAVVVAVALALTPTALGYALATPAVGVAALAWIAWRYWRGEGLLALRASGPVVLVGVGVLTGVVTAQVLVFGPQHAAVLSWVVLPGQDAGLAVVTVIVVIASATNAIYEEFLWRAALTRLHGSKLSVVGVLILSVGFGLAHINGTPGGITGMIYTALFGAAMWTLRCLAGNSVAPCIAVHFAADLILIGGLYVSRY